MNDFAVIFSGASTKIPAHVGAYLAIEGKFPLRSFYGSSSGAIVAACIACGFSGNQLVELVESTDFSMFVKQTWKDWICNVLFRSGIVSGEYLAKFLREIFGDITFEEIDADLHIIGHSLTRRTWVDFSKKNSPDMPIYHAVRISTSIPILFHPVPVRRPSPSGKATTTEWFIDGGVSKDFPVDLVESSRYFAHLIEGPMQFDWSDVSWRQMFEVVLGQLIQANAESSIYHARSGGLVVRTVYKKATTDFRLSQKEKKELIDLGYLNMSSAISSWLGKEKIYDRKSTKPTATK